MTLTPARHLHSECTSLAKFVDEEEERAKLDAEHGSEQPEWEADSGHGPAGSIEQSRVEPMTASIPMLKVTIA